MPESDDKAHALLEALDGTIAALTNLRENGSKRIPVEPSAWRAFCASLAETPAPAPAPMPAVPAPSTVGSKTQAKPETPEQRHASLELLRRESATCQACACACEARFFGIGNAYNPAVAIVNGACMLGDTPTAQGSRLEGEAGELLSKMLRAIGLNLPDLYVTPALKCGVASGKPPQTALAECSQTLRRELTAVNPRVVILLGQTAARTLFPRGLASTGKVGVWELIEGKIPAVTLHHPMRLLLLGEQLAYEKKRENWHVLQALQKRLQQ